MNNPKLWGGRFQQSTDALVEQFTESISFDHILYEQDILGSIAHVRMLSHIGVLAQSETEGIIQGLREIERDIRADKFEWSKSLEDVHMNIEAELTRRIGDVGKKLHTARSRNDQIATDLRLYIREIIDRTESQLCDLQRALLDFAEEHIKTIMPGFTHLQVAQPVIFAHHILAWLTMLERDRDRFLDARKRVNILPLGSAALAGSTFPIDREYCAKELGFDSVSTNSLDAVSDRDFVIEFCANTALLMVHMSRIAEELVLWQSEAYRFIEIGDDFCTGSSIMPQKKNPDVAELIRGKSSRGIGNLMSLLTLMKGQPLTYNRDNQEDKEPLFDSAATLDKVLRVFTAMIPSISVNAERMRNSASQGFATATDLADYLVRKGLPFRDAHEVVGKAVAQCISENIELADLTLEQLQGFHSSIEADVFDALTLEGSVNARNHTGGTAPDQIRAAIETHRRRLGT